MPVKLRKFSERKPATVTARARAPEHEDVIIEEECPLGHPYCLMEKCPHWDRIHKICKFKCKVC